MTRFVIDPGDIKMSEKAAAALNEDLQKTVLSHIANLRIDEPLAIRFPRPFPLGIILRPDFDRLAQAQKELQKAFEQLR